MMSSRTPVFRAFPRVGIPPYYGTWEIYSHRVEQMVAGGAIEDYTYLWWDVRPHPNLGTVELRVFDQQTRIEHTVGLAALSVALAHRLAARFDESVPSVEHPGELIDDNKVRAAVTGIEGELIDFDRGVEVPAAEMVRGVVEQLREHAQELGCEDELVSLLDLVDRGTGARRQLEWLSEHGGDVSGLMGEIVAATEP
jgi:carboxylate-amine ligase